MHKTHFISSMLMSESEQLRNFSYLFDSSTNTDIVSSSIKSSNISAGVNSSKYAYFDLGKHFSVYCKSPKKIFFFQHF